MGAGKSSLRHTFNSHGHRGDCLTRSCTSVRITRSLLGRDRHPRSNAINARCNSVNFDRTHCSHRAGCPGRSASRNLFHRKSSYFCDRGICAGTFVRRISHGENGIPLRKRHSCHHRLIPRSNAAWIIALHRFFEVSVRILVALALAAVWPEHQPGSAKQSAE